MSACSNSVGAGLLIPVGTSRVDVAVAGLERLEDYILGN